MRIANTSYQQYGKANKLTSQFADKRHTSDIVSSDRAITYVIALKRDKIFVS